MVVARLRWQSAATRWRPRTTWGTSIKGPLRVMERRLSSRPQEAARRFHTSGSESKHPLMGMGLLCPVTTSVTGHFFLVWANKRRHAVAKVSAQYQQPGQFLLVRIHVVAAGLPQFSRQGI